MGKKGQALLKKGLDLCDKHYDRVSKVQWNPECKTLTAGEVLLRANKELTTPFTLAEALILPYQNSLEQIPE